MAGVKIDDRLFGQFFSFVVRGHWIGGERNPCSRKHHVTGNLLGRTKVLLQKAGGHAQRLTRIIKSFTSRGIHGKGSCRLDRNAGQMLDREVVFRVG